MAQRLCRGVCRLFEDLGYAALTEFPLANGRRVDVIALDGAGGTSIIEIKSSVTDFRTDRKWQEYRAFCDRLYFAVASDFPPELIPDECGLIIADPFGAAILRKGAVLPLAAARRRAMLLRFAAIAAGRLRRLTDPGIDDPELG